MPVSFKRSASGIQWPRNRCLLICAYFVEHASDNKIGTTILFFYLITMKMYDFYLFKSLVFSVNCLWFSLGLTAPKINPRERPRGSGRIAKVCRVQKCFHLISPMKLRNATILWIKHSTSKWAVFCYYFLTESSFLSFRNNEREWSNRFLSKKNVRKRKV